MPHIDFFHFFRVDREVVVGLYATIITLQSLYGWYIWLSGSDKYISLVRRYVIVQGLRLRFTKFWGDLLICLLLCVAMFFIWRAHVAVGQIGNWTDDHGAGIKKLH